MTNYVRVGIAIAFIVCAAWIHTAPSRRAGSGHRPRLSHSWIVPACPVPTFVNMNEPIAPSQSTSNAPPWVQEAVDTL